MEELAYSTVLQRIAALILRLIDKYGLQHADEIRLKIPLSHKEIAFLIGSSRETVTETLNRMRLHGMYCCRFFLLPAVKQRPQSVVLLTTLAVTVFATRLAKKAMKTHLPPQGAMK